MNLVQWQRNRSTKYYLIGGKSTYANFVGDVLMFPYPGEQLFNGVLDSCGKEFSPKTLPIVLAVMNNYLKPKGHKLSIIEVQ